MIRFPAQRVEILRIVDIANVYHQYFNAFIDFSHMT